MDLRPAALAWAHEILRAHWAPERYRLEPERERLRLHRGRDRQVYALDLQVWEREGLAELRPGPDGDWSCVLFPAEAPAEAVPRPLPDAAAAVARRAAPSDGGLLRAERALGGAGPALWAVVERRRPDGLLGVELDLDGGERVGFVCLPFERGSRQSAALGRASVVERAGTQLRLPPEARLRSARLQSGPGRRVWTLRWEATEGERRGWVRATFNARSGRLCGLSRSLRPVAPVEGPGRASQASAERALALGARLRFGDRARVGIPAPGLVRVGGALRAGWLAVVHAPRGLYRAVLADERVRFVKLRPRRRA